MSSSEKMPVGINRIVAQFGIDRIYDIQKVRMSLAEIASAGTPLLPDFTLHNEQHSDNLIRLLGRLRKEFGLKLGRYEAFLLAASAYLHDLGMFFDGAAFKDTILPDPASALSFCPERLCDTVENYRLFGQDTGEQIRETNSLLSAYWLYNDVTPIEGITDEDKPYLIAICRGHGKADLRERKCRCYETVQHNDEEIRIDLLTSLLRLVDAMDFYSNRTPAKVFRKNATTLLRNPIALGHWIKHYFVQAPFVTKVNKGGNFILECTVYFAVPMKKLNGVRYIDFFSPLFEGHIEEVQKWDLDINQYPPDLTTALGINDIKMVLDERELTGGRDLPDRIVQEIAQSECINVSAFLEQRAKIVEQESVTGVEKASGADRTGSPLPAIPSGPVLIVDDHPWYLNHLRSILEKAGYQCKLAETFEDALGQLKKCHPFVLVLDMKLGRDFKGGWELARRAADDGVHLIIVTGYPSIEGVSKAVREFSVVDFLDKGRLTPEKLIARVSEAAQSQRKKKLSREQRQELFERILGFFPSCSA